MRNAGTFSYSRDSFTKFFYTINKKNYLFRATFINADGVRVDFQKGAIKELYLNDVIYNPFLKGYMIVDNTDDVIERYKSNPSFNEFVGAIPDRGYKTRGDARDLVLLTILPVEPSMDPYNEQSLEYNRIFGLQYVFCLGDEEDMITDTGKNKKYSLVDFDQEVLKEKKIFFSSGNLSRKKDLSNLTDQQRDALTGDSLKEILTLGLNNKNVIQTTLSGSNYITPFFESGASKLFYSSPNNNTAYDDLVYIYNLHVSNDAGKDFSFLQKDHFTGEYTLMSASSIFAKAYDKTSDAGGKYFVENLTITGVQDNSNIIENDIKKPLRALEFGESGDVVSVKFFNTPGTEYQEKVRTLLVHSYNFEDKVFDINCVDGNIENVKKDFTTLFVQPMKGKDNRPSPNFIINETQKNIQNFDNVFLPYEEDNDFLRLSLGRNRVLKNALKLNLGVEVLVQGGLQRGAGKFISIDRKGTYIDNDFDNKFLGIYFILSVDHFFVNEDQFFNKILAVKTYHYVDPKINENIP